MSSLGRVQKQHPQIAAWPELPTWCPIAAPSTHTRTTCFLNPYRPFLYLAKLSKNGLFTANICLYVVVDSPSSWSETSPTQSEHDTINFIRKLLNWLLNDIVC